MVSISFWVGSLRIVQIEWVIKSVFKQLRVCFTSQAIRKPDDADAADNSKKIVESAQRIFIYVANTSAFCRSLSDACDRPWMYLQEVGLQGTDSDRCMGGARESCSRSTARRSTRQRLT